MPIAIISRTTREILGVEEGDGLPGGLAQGLVAVRCDCESPEAAREQADALLDLARRGEILEELKTLDLAAIRPLRAEAAGTATAEDQARLAELEARARDLRTELQTLEDA